MMCCVLPGPEWDGISCDYCHKVRKVIKDNSKPSGRAAILERQSPARGNSILIFGPYDDVTAPPMAASYNSLFDEGQFCVHFVTVTPKSWQAAKPGTAARCIRRPNGMVLGWAAPITFPSRRPIRSGNNGRISCRPTIPTKAKNARTAT